MQGELKSTQQQRILSAQLNCIETRSVQCVEIRRRIDRHQCWSGFGSNWAPHTGGGRIPHSTRYLYHSSRSHLFHNSCDNATFSKQPLLFYSQCHHHLAVGALRAYHFMLSAVGCRPSVVSQLPRQGANAYVACAWIDSGLSCVPTLFGTLGETWLATKKSERETLRYLPYESRGCY